MPRHEFTDVPGGDTIHYDVVDEKIGYRQANFNHTIEKHQEYFDNIVNLQCRDQDILLNSYPKTGTNWLWEMLSMVLNKSSDVTGDMKGPGMLEAVSPETTQGLPSPRILNTHIKIRYLPKEAKEGKMKMVLLMRNPKDVAVSFYNHTLGFKLYQYSGKFENYLQMFMRGEVDYGSYPEYLREWQTFIQDNPDSPVHVLYYEDMKQDCVREMKKVCMFLEWDVADDLLQQIVDACQIDNLRQEKVANMPEELVTYMRTHVLKDNFTVYRKGQIGDWKNWFTVAQNECFQQWWTKETQDITMFDFKYT